MKRTTLILAALALLSGWPGQAQADLILNGGFETGNFTDWTTNGAPSLVVEPNGYAGIPSHSGDYDALFGSNGAFPGVISQTVADTSGANYSLQMWLWSDGGGNNAGTPNDEFKIAWNGTTISDMINIPAQPYTLLSLTVVGTGSDTLTLTGFDNGDNPGALGLDDVSLNPATAAAPEPSSLAVAGIGILGFIGEAWRRRRKQAAAWR
jgi:hypothetical protein